MSRPARIYALLDDDGCIRYVGYTLRTIEQRLDAHMRWLRRTESTRHLAQWLRSLGHRPSIVLIEEITEDQVDERERYWIKYFRDNGCDLVNGTAGGKGTLGHKQSAEQIEKRRVKLRGHACSAEARLAISKANYGRRRSDTAKKIMSDLKLGKSWTQARREAHISRYGPPPAIANPISCTYCLAGPFRGMRGLARHYEHKHDGQYKVGSYDLQ